MWKRSKKKGAAMEEGLLTGLEFPFLPAHMVKERPGQPSVDAGATAHRGSEITREGSLVVFFSECGIFFWGGGVVFYLTDASKRCDSMCKL